MLNKKYRHVPYQVKYRKDLTVCAKSDVSVPYMAKHFSQNGYENIYVEQNNELYAVISYDDFCKGNTIIGSDRPFIFDLSTIHSEEDIMRIFIDNPTLDRITIINNNRLLCEIDGLIELQLQNGIAKSLMSLRYLSFFHDELDDYFTRHKKILIIANTEIVNHLENSFPNQSFDSISSGEPLLKGEISNEYDMVIDFVYCKRIRERLGLEINNIIGLPKLLTTFAYKRLQSFCKSEGIHTYYYEVPSHTKLTCLNQYEADNSINKRKLGDLLTDNHFYSQYVSGNDEKAFISSRTYHASIRKDDGFCFIQEECNNELLHVHHGIRYSGQQDSSNVNLPNVTFFGPCATYGFLVPDEKTIPSLFLAYAHKDKISITVSNCAGIHGYNELNAFMTALRTPAKAGDCFVFFDVREDLTVDECPQSDDVSLWLNTEKSKEETWFMDFPGHWNAKANELIAKHMYMQMKPVLINSYRSNGERASYIQNASITNDILKITHSSSVKFYNMYNNHFLPSHENNVIGAIVLPDGLSPENYKRLIIKALCSCDALYAFKYNVNLESISNDSSIFSHTEEMYSNKAIRLMQLPYYFYANRYLNTDNYEDDYENTIKDFIFTIIRPLSIDKVFLTRENSNQFMIDVYQKEKTDISLISIEEEY